MENNHPIWEWGENVNKTNKRIKRLKKMYLFSQIFYWFLLGVFLIHIFIITPKKEKAAYNKGKLDAYKHIGLELDSYNKNKNYGKENPKNQKPKR